MEYKLQDLIDLEKFQNLQNRLNEIYPFPSAIIDNNGNILTATAWQDICTLFHRNNKESEKECIKSDQYILDHLHEADPAISYLCPFGLVDNALPIIIGGVHYANFFTGQFFLDPPDLEKYRCQAKTYGFDEKAYLDAVQKVPVWTKQQRDSYLLLIKELIAVISESGLKKLREIELEERSDSILARMLDGFWITDALNGKILDVNESMCLLVGYSRDELLQMSVADVDANDPSEVVANRIQDIIRTGRAHFETRFRRNDGALLDIEVSVVYLPNRNVLFGFHRDITERKRAEVALQRSEERYRALFEKASDGIFYLTPDMRIVAANESFAKMHGYSVEEMQGMKLQHLSTPEPSSLIPERTADLLAGANLKFEVEHYHKLGYRFPMEVSSSSISIGDEKYILSFNRDITERKHREIELEAVVTMSASLRLAHTRAEMLPIIIHQISELVNAASVALLMIDMLADDFVIEQARGVWEGNIGKHIPRADHILNQVINSSEPYLSNNLQDNRDLIQCTGIGKIKGFIEIPLVADQVVIGFLEVASHETFTQQDVRLLTAISGIAANAIHRASLHEQTKRIATDLTQAYDATLEGWVHALEMRDQETEGHTRRVVQMTVDLARLAGIDEDKIDNIRRGALLHDIGKMAIPDSVLLKPGTLNEREWEIMQQHPEYALNLLKPIEHLRPVLDIPYCHHEKWDGNGYPRRLTGEQIPLAARIFAIIDVWDALTSDRPYRPAWTKEKALAYIQGQKGMHFDPIIVDLFMEMIVSRDSQESVH